VPAVNAKAAHHPAGLLNEIMVSPRCLDSRSCGKTDRRLPSYADNAAPSINRRSNLNKVVVTGADFPVGRFGRRRRGRLLRRDRLQMDDPRRRSIPRDRIGVGIGIAVSDTQIVSKRPSVSVRMK
jgi:hypothetical protein